MAEQNSNCASANLTLPQKLNKMIADGSLDYNSWRSLVLEIETSSPDDIKTISLAYDSFLSTFPLCHWHLEKYAFHKAKLCSPQEAVNIYERGAETAMFSVGFWVDYLTFSSTSFEPEDVRRLFGRAVSFVGKDYSCHVLWDKYMKYEFRQEGWSFLAQSYIEALRFPTKKLHFYHDNFRQFVANLEEEIGYERNNSIEQISVPSAEIKISRDEISLVVEDLLGSSDKSLKSKALGRYRSIGEQFYQEARKMDEKIKCFETKVVRRYFHVTPLDDNQLKDWHVYLDFIEKQDNLDMAVKLYERCLIPCANYPEFWMRYVEFLDAKGGRELAISALDRATRIFLKNVAEIHLFSARFKERIGDINGARAALVLCDTKIDSNFIEYVVTLANLERRLGNDAAASATYEKALIKARETQKLHVLPTLYSQFARLTFLITGSAAATRDVLIEGVRQVPHCRFLLEELIKFAMTREGERQVNIVESVITDAISHGLDEYEGLNAKDREQISCLFLEFVNLCGTTHDVRNAWNRHIKLFPHILRKHSTNYSIDLVTDQKRKLLPQSDQTKSTDETVQIPSTKAVVLFDKDAVSQDPSQKSRKKQTKMDVSDELANKQSNGNSLSPHEVKKSTETIDSVEVSRSNLDHPVSSDKISLKSPEKESQDLVPMSCDEYETKKKGVAESNESTKMGISEVTLQLHSEPTKVHRDQEEPSSAGDDPIEIDRRSQLGAVEEYRETPRTTSAISSYPQQETNQANPQSSENQFQEQQSSAMSQMLQYYYHHQQIYQQQQQQLYQQHPYYQMQQPYYTNQQTNQQPPYQHQSLPYQQQQSQQIVGQMQLQQNQQSHQLAYQQNVTQGQQQQMLLQQYQQYQGYQYPQYSNEGAIQHQHQQVISNENPTENMSQDQQVSKTSAADYGGASRLSESPHLRVQSPQ